MSIKNITCIGAGYVGGPTMAVIALKCPKIKITVVDSNSSKIDKWNGPIDNIPVYEPGLSDIIKKTRNKNLFFSPDIKSGIESAEMIFMAVNTPTKQIGEGAGMAADLKYVEACAKDIAKFSKNNKIVIEKSTLPVRTAEKIKDILKKNSKVEFEVLSNPEFLAEGTAINDLFKSDRVLIGGDNTKSGKKAIKSLVEIYEKWIPKEKILTTNVWSSELSKLASNAFLAQRISSINSLSAICEKSGADIDELSKAIGMDHRIGPHFLKASVGFGGSCFKKDILNLVYISRSYGLNEVADYWESVIKINDFQKNRFVKKISSVFNNNLKNKKILILGWAFKANTNDSRESASIYVTEKLHNLGAIIDIYDPMVSSSKVFSDIELFWKFNFDKSRINFVRTLPKSTYQYDIAAILTEWEDFKEIDYGNTEVFDGRNILKNKKITNYYEI